MPGLKVFALTGAGISAESGIPTFRGREGYWRNRDPRTLATPEAFARDPEMVWTWYRERRARVRASRPNAAHEALVRLSEHARDFLLLTQNVDDLHRRATWEHRHLRADRMVQIHGDLFTTRCSRCDRTEDDDDEDAPSGVPRCRSCGAPMRPGVVWFGEPLDPRPIARVERYLASGPADLVLVIGTTAVFDYIVSWALEAAGSTGEIVEINPEPTRLSRVVTRSIRQPAAEAVPLLVEEIVKRR